MEIDAATGWIVQSSGEGLFEGSMTAVDLGGA
jgi:hypothetical protein